MPVVLRPVPRFEKYPNEIINQAVDFTAILDVGETISGCSVTAKVRETGADATSTVLSGAPSVAGTTVVYRVTGGTATISYILSVNATLSSSEIYSQRVRMDVVEEP